MIAVFKEMAVIWWEYRRTLYALEQLGPRSLADLSIDHERLREVAWKAARNRGALSISDLKIDPYESTGRTLEGCELTASMGVPDRWCGKHQTPAFGPSGSRHHRRSFDGCAAPMDSAQRRDAPANSG